VTTRQLWPAAELNLTNPLVPGNTKWLSPVERAFLQARLPQNLPQSSEKNFVGKEIIKTPRDTRLWPFTLSWALMNFGKNGIDFYRTDKYFQHGLQVKYLNVRQRNALY
jgi:hypothetical protein